MSPVSDVVLLCTRIRTRPAALLWRPTRQLIDLWDATFDVNDICESEKESTHLSELRQRLGNSPHDFFALVPIKALLAALAIEQRIYPPRSAGQ
jgi:hypothetical protein